MRDIKPYVAIATTIAMLTVGVLSAGSASAGSASAKSEPVKYDSTTDELYYKDGNARTPIDVGGAAGKVGSAGANGKAGVAGADGMSGLSLTAALHSFSVAGVGVGVAGNSDALEVSIGLGTTFSTQGHLIMGVTHEVTTGRTIGTAGIGWSF